MKSTKKCHISTPLLKSRIDLTSRNKRYNKNMISYKQRFQIIVIKRHYAAIKKYSKENTRGQMEPPNKSNKESSCSYLPQSIVTDKIGVFTTTIVEHMLNLAKYQHSQRSLKIFKIMSIRILKRSIFK